MALNSPVLPQPTTQSQAQRQAQTFEFTKRKNWADILFSELPDTVIIVLDTEGLIQYVGPTANEVFGWEAEDLSETDFLDIVNVDDKKSFIDHFERSLSTRQDLSCYVRLKCRPPTNASPKLGTGQKELLFELRGHALYLPNDNECKCFFLSAKPFPSRNTAALNTFLELKIENERLTQRLRDLKTDDDVISGRFGDAPTLSHPNPPGSQYSSIEFSPLQGPSGNTVGNFSTVQTGFIHHSTVPSTNPRDEGDDQDDKKNKKLKKKHIAVQQYVCVVCGRTDSPEWRKGPRGPKTLCNACGLRWAKSSKRTDDVPIPYVQGQGSRKGQEGAGSTPPAPTTSGRGSKGVPVANPALSVTPTHTTSSVVQPVQQQQIQQGRCDTQAPVTSPAQPTFPQACMVPSTQVPAIARHYAIHALPAATMHHQNAQQPSPTVEEFVHAQPQGGYHGYEFYPWLMDGQRDGGYGH